VLSWGFLFRTRQRLKGSLWVVPALGAIFGAGLAQLIIALEGSVHLPAELTYTPSTATAVLSSIVAAMVGLTGFVVTIGVLIVQMASQSLSPRYMRLWYRDLLQKCVLALFLGTLTFSFGLLRHIGSRTVPNLGVNIAGFAVALGLVLFILYLDRFVHRLRPVAVSALVGRQGQAVFTREAALFEDSSDAVESPMPAAGPAVVARSRRGGTIQAVDLKGLVRISERCDGRIVLARAIGDFVPRGAPLAHVFCDGPGPTEEQLLGMVALGDERTIDQDPAFALRILVDVALMALSPAVNAPTTAVQVLDNVEEFLQCVGTAELGRLGLLRDRSGSVRVLIPRRTWVEYLDLGVTEIREYGETSTQVTRRLRAVLESILASVPAAHRAAVQAQSERLDSTLAMSISDPERRAYAGGSDPQGIGGISSDERERVFGGPAGTPVLRGEERR
jgi:uncharacterized membrane protein